MVDSHHATSFYSDDIFASTDPAWSLATLAPVEIRLHIDPDATPSTAGTWKREDDSLIDDAVRETLGIGGAEAREPMVYPLGPAGARLGGALATTMDIEGLLRADAAHGLSGRLELEARGWEERAAVLVRIRNASQSAGNAVNHEFEALGLPRPRAVAAAGDNTGVQLPHVQTGTSAGTGVAGVAGILAGIESAGDRLSPVSLEREPNEDSDG